MALLVLDREEADAAQAPLLGALAAAVELELRDVGAERAGEAPRVHVQGRGVEARVHLLAVGA